jgi:transposase
MRSVALDLGSKIAFCEINDGEVTRRTTVRYLHELERELGPDTQPARVAFEACREGWYVHKVLREWGHEPLMVDTTRVRQLGVGQHQRKTDRIDAEVLARAVERGSVPLAHVLSPARQWLRLHISVRRVLVEARSQYVRVVRGLTRARGHILPKCEVEWFTRKVKEVTLDDDTSALVEPLLSLVDQTDQRIYAIDAVLDRLTAEEPVTKLLQTAPGVGPVVAAAFVSVIDDAHRFDSAHQVEAYLGLVPAEFTSVTRRLGAITKQGNGYLRAMLVQAAWAILKGKTEDPLKLWGQAVIARRGKKVGAVALDRRLVGLLWAMWRDDTIYDPTRVGLSSAAGTRQEAQSLQLRAAALERAAEKTRRARRRRPKEVTSMV